jgi:hypothetical protein
MLIEQADAAFAITEGDERLTQQFDVHGVAAGRG